MPDVVLPDSISHIPPPQQSPAGLLASAFRPTGLYPISISLSSYRTISHQHQSFVLLEYIPIASAFLPTGLYLISICFHPTRLYPNRIRFSSHRIISHQHLFLFPPEYIPSASAFPLPDYILKKTLDIEAMISIL